MKIGIDLGGTKTEGILIDNKGKELTRKRTSTEKNYAGTLKGISNIIREFTSLFRDLSCGIEQLAFGTSAESLQPPPGLLPIETYIFLLRERERESQRDAL